jgi:hypothetical protein
MFRRPILIAVSVLLVTGSLSQAQTANTAKATYKIHSLAHLGDDPQLGAWIAKTIREVVAPGTWDACCCEDPQHVLSYYAPGKILVVSHTPAVQAQVEVFLNDMQKALAAQKPAAPIAQAPPPTLVAPMGPMGPTVPTGYVEVIQQTQVAPTPIPGAPYFMPAPMVPPPMPPFAQASPATLIPGMPPMGPMGPTGPTGPMIPIIPTRIMEASFAPPLGGPFIRFGFGQVGDPCSPVPVPAIAQAAHIVPASNQPALPGTPAVPATAPEQKKTPRHLFHIILEGLEAGAGEDGEINGYKLKNFTLRYEGEGLIDSNIVELFKNGSIKAESCASALTEAAKAGVLSATMNTEVCQPAPSVPVSSAPPLHLDGGPDQIAPTSRPRTTGPVTAFPAGATNVFPSPRSEEVLPMPRRVGDAK